MMDRQSLGRRINQARKECGFTSDYLSELCHINATYLRQIEGGSKTPSLPVFVDLCNALNVSPAFLLKDVLTKEHSDPYEELSKLWESAAPHQLELVTAMIKAALPFTNRTDLPVSQSDE